MPQGLNGCYFIYRVTRHVTNGREIHLPSPAKPPLLSKIDKKRTHQALNLGEFVAKGVNCDTRDGCGIGWVHSHFFLTHCTYLH